MIGNDIIDLTLARKQSNWQRKGLMDKLFSTAEQQLILNDKQPEFFFWHLWSRKEAAYKIFNRINKIRSFNPRYFQCDAPIIIDDAWLGKVVSEQQVYWVRTQIHPSHIYSEAVLNREDFNNIKKVNRVDICKDLHGIPYHRTTHNPITVTHHGKFEKLVQLDRQIEP